MRKIILVLFIIFYGVAYAQVIKGTIYSEKTKSPIGQASVYFNGTFVGTTSDINGYFELNCVHNSSMPLTFSAIGYYSTSVINFLKGRILNIYLKPKEYTIKEAVVKSKSLVRKRKKYLALFRDEFLGTTHNAGECKILNEKDISFNYFTDKDTIKAFALKPIQLDNRALGYKVTYYLDKFEYYKRKEATFFSGNIIFLEDVATDTARNQMHENRRYSYLFSRMQFIRALGLDSLHKNELLITNQMGKVLTCKNIVASDSKNNKYLSYPGNLKVCFSKQYNSTIIFLKKYVYFDKTGYFDPSGINWTGDMSLKRIADWLPYEYTY